MTLHREYEEAEKNDELICEDWDEVYDMSIITFMRKREYEPTFEEIKQLRKEICLNSIYYDDYQNTLMLDEWEVCNFFGGYLEELGYRVEERVGEQLANRISDDDWLKMMFELDSDDALECWYMDWLAANDSFTQYYYEEVVEEFREAI